MTYTEQVQAAIPKIRERMKKADSFDTIVPAVLSCSVQLADGDAAKGRQVASMAAPIAEVIAPRPWAAGMTTIPGEFVLSPDGKRTYIYTGKEAMTHANQTYYPGAAGVYYWAVVPEMHDGYRVFPDISGIVVAVKQNEIWWNPAKTKRYRWTGSNYDCPSNYYPGAAGVYQWEAVA